MTSCSVKPSRQTQNFGTLAWSNKKGVPLFHNGLLNGTYSLFFHKRHDAIQQAIDKNTKENTEEITHAFKKGL